MEEGEMVSDADLDDEYNASRFLVMGAYGETIFRFQCLELSFWSIMAHRQKRGMSFDQRMNKVEAWDGKQTLGDLVKVANLPESLNEEAKEAVAARNYLVHRFMRERAPFLDGAAYCQRVGEELAEVNGRLDDFEERLDQYRQSLGIPYVTDDELGELGLDDLHPATWISENMEDWG